MDSNTPYILSNTGVMHFETNDFRSISESLCHSSSAIVGNNEWCWQLHRNKKELEISLDCNKNVNYSRLWSCEATYSFVICNLYEEGNDIVITRRQIFDRNNTDAFLNEDILIDGLGNKVVKDNKFKMRVEITVHESSGFRMPVLGTFDRPVEHLTDVVLLVEDKKVYIGKQALTTHSGYFRAMFFGSFAEESKEEIDLKDVKHLEFVDLLNMIFPSHLKFNEYNIAHILKLANRFEVHKVMDKAEQFLLHSQRIPAKLKSELLGSYHFPRHENHSDDQPGLYDAFLVTGNKEFPIGKQTMAMHSEYFRRLFFENEHPIDRVIFDEVGSVHIEDFLRLVFKPQQYFTVDNIDSHLHLAHRFEMWKILEEGEQFLLRNRRISAVVKLELAQKYNFPLLQNATIRNWSTTHESLRAFEGFSFENYDENSLKLLLEKLSVLSRWVDFVQAERMEAEREAAEEEESDKEN